MAKLNLFKRKNVEVETRDSTPFSYGGLSVSAYFGNTEKISEEQALKIPSVSASIELITSSIAQLPIYLYQSNKDDEIIKVPDSRVALLNNEPNPALNGYNFKKQIVKDYLLYGASYIKVDRTRNLVDSLYVLPILDLMITKYKNGYKETARIQLNNTGDNKEYNFSPDELIMILKNSRDGYTSSGILNDNGDVLQLALNEQNYSNGVLKNGALPVGLLKTASRLNEKAINALRESWQNLYGGASKAGKTLILENGLDYQPISLNPNEMDLTNSKKSTISEIARMFNIPESMINSGANKYASNEQNNIYFLQYCISPIINAIESSLNKSLLLETEKSNGYYFRFDTSELIRTTEKEKIEAVSAGIEKGLLSINEGRQRLGLPNIAENLFMWSLGKIFYNPDTNKMTIPNTSTQIDTNKNTNEETDNPKPVDSSEEDNTDPLDDKET